MFKQILAAFTLCAAFIAPAQAMSVLPLYLDEIVDQAAVAFEGTVTDVRSDRDADGRAVTYTTFAVHDQLKGQTASTHTIKQLGGEVAEGMNYRVQGIPKFTVDQTVVVFLYGKSSKGFSSPVGLSQGRFLVSSDEEGRQVSNGADFRDMAPGLADDAQLAATERAKLKSDKPVRKMALDTFKQVVRKRAHSRDTASGAGQ
jgi:hypothetical protein